MQPTPRYYDDDNFLQVYAMALEVAINKSRPGSGFNAPLGPPANDDIFTNIGHIVLDKIAKHFADRAHFEEQVKRIEVCTNVD